MHALDPVLETVKREFDVACAQVTRAARCQITNELNQVLRRLRHYKSEGEWVHAVLDGASRFVQHVAVFSVHQDSLNLRGQHKLDLPAGLSFSISSAAAFAGALESREPVIALRIPAEVTDTLSSAEPGERAHIVPIMNGSRVAAVIFAADQEYTDVNALELMAGLASAVLERKANAALHAQIGPVAIAQGDGSDSNAAKDVQAESKSPESQKSVGQREATQAKATLPPWSSLNQKDRNLHIRAQRFSRVRVAEIHMARPDASRTGREQNNLYLYLKNEIDQARAAYRKQFMVIPSMVDYLHLELVNVAAEGDELKLGADYPGQLA